MTSDAKPVSFLATLDLKDGTRLGFSSIAVGVDGKSKSEPQDKLCANTLLNKSLVVELRYVGQEGYALSLWGYLAGPEVNPATGGRPAFARIDRPGIYEEGFVSESAYARALQSEQITSAENSSDLTEGEDSAAAAGLEKSKSNFPADLAEAPKPEALNPGIQRSTESLYIGVDKFGWISKTQNNGLTFLATIFDEGRKPLAIEGGNTHLVYLKSWISKNYIQTYKREDLPDKNWFAWMTDCDGDDAVLKLTVIGIYDADGEIRFLI